MNITHVNSQPSALIELTYDETILLRKLLGSISGGVFMNPKLSLAMYKEDNETQIAIRNLANKLWDGLLDFQDE